METLEKDIPIKVKKSRTIAQQAGMARRRLKKEGVEFIEDYKGVAVPLDYVPDIDLVEHFLTLQLIAEAKEIKTKLQEFKYKVQSQGDQLYHQMLADHNVESKEIKNFSLSTLNKKLKIRFTRPPHYTHDEKQLAISRDYKTKFLMDVAGDVDAYVVNLIEELLENSTGDIDPAKKSKLNQLATKIKNKNFLKMVDHYNQSLDAYYAKRYEQFLEKDEQGQENGIIMTYASLSPVNAEEEA